MNECVGVQDSRGAERASNRGLAGTWQSTWGAQWGRSPAHPYARSKPRSSACPPPIPDRGARRHNGPRCTPCSAATRAQPTRSSTTAMGAGQCVPADEGRLRGSAARASSRRSLRSANAYGRAEVLATPRQPGSSERTEQTNPVLGAPTCRRLSFASLTALVSAALLSTS